MKRKIGEIKPEIITALNLEIPIGTELYIGESNIEHMKSRHPEDYEKYGHHLEIILAEPDYIGQNPKDQSLEYVKIFIENGEYVKIAVRISKNETHFIRSLYILNKNRVENFIKKGTLIAVKVIAEV